MRPFCSFIAYLKLLNADRCPVNFSFILVVIVNIFHQETYYRGRSKVMSTGCRTIAVVLDYQLFGERGRLSLLGGGGGGGSPQYGS